MFAGLPTLYRVLELLTTAGTTQGAMSMYYMDWNHVKESFKYLMQRLGVIQDQPKILKDLDSAFQKAHSFFKYDYAHAHVRNKDGDPYHCSHLALCGSCAPVSAPVALAMPVYEPL